MRQSTTGFFVIALALVSFAAPSFAGPIEGGWKGSGRAKLKGGQVEPVSCRLSYSKDTGRTYLVNVNCSHSAGTFHVTGRVVEQSSTKYTGRLYSDQYSVAGNVSINVNGNVQTITAVSERGTARLKLRKQ